MVVSVSGRTGISVRSDVKEVTRYLSKLDKKQVPFATRVALNRTARGIVKEDMPLILPRVFDRPTRWTLQGFYSYQPRGRELVAYVNMKDGGTRDPGRGGKIGTPAFAYLRTQIKGGRRGEKSHERQLRRLGILGTDEYTVPGRDMRLNKFGNLAGSTYAKILADVQAKTFDTPPGQRYDLSAGQATLKRGKKRYFYSPNLRPRGIYLRTSRRRLIVALLFVKAPRYRARFDFAGIVEKQARRRFPFEFRRAITQAIATAKR